MTGSATPSVVLYVVPGCPLCDDARDWLSRRKIGYVERDVANDFGARKRFYKHTRQNLVPVIEFGDKFFVRPSDEELRKIFDA